MSDPVKENDLIALREDIPKHDLLRGRIGRILQVFSPDEFEVEFVAESARTIAKVRLKLEQVRVLRHEMTLDDADFWKLIGAAKAESEGDSERQVELLVDKLAERSIADIFAFGELFQKYRGNAYRRELWAAGFIICDGCSDDGFTDFRAWLIAQGEKVYYAALRDPEILVDFAPIQCDGYTTYGNAMLEGMNYVAWDAYEKRTGEDAPIFCAMHSHPELTGEDWDEATVYQKYPKLADKFEPKPCDEDSNF